MNYGRRTDGNVKGLVADFGCEAIGGAVYGHLRQRRSLRGETGRQRERKYGKANNP
jgi:hypothetical protein